MSDFANKLLGMIANSQQPPLAPLVVLSDIVLGEPTVVFKNLHTCNIGAAVNVYCGGQKFVLFCMPAEKDRKIDIMIKDLE